MVHSRSFALVVVTAAVALSSGSAAEVQITQARSVNMENARRLFTMIVDDINADKRGDAARKGISRRGRGMKSQRAEAMPSRVARRVTNHPPRETVE